jgi:uncharacterized protein YjbI with pentapeptide repeats
VCCGICGEDPLQAVATCYASTSREFLHNRRDSEGLVHRGFIVGGYDGDQNVRAEERSVDQEKKLRQRLRIRELVPDRQPTRERVPQVIRIAILGTFAVLSVLLLLYVIGSFFGAGRVRLTSSPLSLWDVLKVLAVPITAGAAVPWLNWLQKKRELAIAEQRAQNEALQGYLDKISELLIDKKLHEKSNDYDAARVTARAQTLAVLERLDAQRKRTVLLFLREARLINRNDYPEEGPYVLYYAHYVVLENADLSGANLEDARLISTSGKEPISLKGANLKAAKLSGAILRKADLSSADLSGADLSYADLTNATVTVEQLATCKRLEGATMLDGQILNSDDNPDGPSFKEWLRSQEPPEAPTEATEQPGGRGAPLQCGGGSGERTVPLVAEDFR